LTAALVGREDAHPMSKEAARRALEAQLGQSVPRGVARLSAEELNDLADAVRLARRRQAEALSEAGERALHRIPRLLRGPIRKVAGG
jgi:hypothetical protein